MIDLLLSVFHPMVMLILGVIVAVYYIRLVWKYSHVCFNRWDLILIIVAVLGVVLFDTILVALIGVCGSLLSPCVDFLAVSLLSRIMRAVWLSVLLVIGHGAAIRQRNANRLILEVLDGPGDD